MGEKRYLALEETLQEAKAALSEASDTIGTANDTAENRTLFGAIALKSGLCSVVKSVQRGVAKGTSLEDIVITINAVDPSKCVVLLNSQYSGVEYAAPAAFYQNEIDNYSTYSYLSRLISLEPETLTISVNFARCIFMSSGEFKNGGYYGNISWQILEFY